MTSRGSTALRLGDGGAEVTFSTCVYGGIRGTDVTEYRSGRVTPP